MVAGSALAAVSLFGFSEAANAAADPAVPIGSLDSIVAGVGTAQVNGWAIEPDSTAATNVQIFVDGVYNQTVAASTERDDVGAAYPGFGVMHGYSATVTGLSSAAHTIAVYAINDNGIQADNVLLGTQSVTPLNSASFGSVDMVAETTGDNVRVAGWAIDPKTTQPITVAVYVDGVLSTDVSASGARTDVATAFPAFGADHGYDVTVPVPADGAHTVDVYAIDSTGSGVNPLLAQDNVMVNSASFGSVDVVAQATGDNVRVAGWAIDPKTTAPTMVAIYVDGVLSTDVLASASRPDVGAVFPALGANHGYDVTVPVPADGAHTVDVYAIDSTGNGVNPLLAHNTVNVSTSLFGSVDAASQTTADDVLVAGWAIDPKTTGPINVAVYIDGLPVGVSTANATRSDVGAAFPTFGSDHGYFITLPIPTLGTHTVDVYGIDSTGNGNNPLLGRRTVEITGSALA